MASKGVSFSSDSASSSDSGKLAEIFWRLEPRTGKIPLAGRCHKLPRKLEHDYALTSKVLGTGYNGKVTLARSRVNSKQTVAIKSFKLKGLCESKKERLMAETSIFLCMDHPHVARLVDVYESEHHISLVMECMQGGELFDRVTTAKHFTEPAAADAMRQMLLALNYLHSQGMVHRDVKLENFLYDSQADNHLKMIDFGFSKFFDTKSRMKTSCGTLAYVAPEVLKRSYTSQCDLWSMGVIVFILLSGRMPFFGDSEDQMADIRKGRYIFKPVHWANVSKEGQEFTKALLEVDPSKRLTSKSALEHHWLKQSFQDATPPCDDSIVAAFRSWHMAPKFHRACMSMMAWSLTNKHHAVVRDHFLALDKNHDGSISFDEFRGVMQGSDDESGDSEVREIFDLLAHDHEAAIHYSGFLAAMSCSYFELEEDLLKVTFKKFDTDGSGFITPADLRNILKESSEGDSMILEGDLNGDGKLDYGEFAKYVRSSTAKLQDSHSAKSFDAFEGSPEQVPVLLGRQRPPFDVSAVQKVLDPVQIQGLEVIEGSVSNTQPVCCVVQ